MDKKIYDKMKGNSREALNRNSKPELLDHIFNLYKVIQNRWLEIDELNRALKYSRGIMVVLIIAIIIILMRVDTWI